MSKTAVVNTVTKRMDTSIRTLKAHDLFQGGRSVLIEHNGENYRLQLTRSHKLILTK